MEQQLAAANAEIELLEQKLQTSQSNERNVQSVLHDNEGMLRKVQLELAAEKSRANTSSHAGSSSGHEKHEPDVEKLREESQSGGRIQFADTAFSPWSSKDPWRSIHSYTPAPSTGFGSGSLLVPLEKAKSTVMSKPTLFSAPMANQSPRKAGCGETRPMAAPSSPSLPAPTDLFLSRSQNLKLEPSSSTASTKSGQPKQRPLDEETKTAGSINSAVSVPKSQIDAKSYPEQRPLRDNSNVSRFSFTMKDNKDGQSMQSHRDIGQNIAQVISGEAETETENEDSDDNEVFARNVRVFDAPDWLKPGCKGRAERPISTYVKPSILDPPESPKEIKEISNSYDIAEMDGEFGTRYRYGPSSFAWGVQQANSMSPLDASIRSIYKHGPGERLKNSIPVATSTRLVTGEKRPINEPSISQSSKRSKSSPSDHQ